MPTLKYINIKDIVKLTGVPAEEIRQLAANGTLPAHKAHRGHWRLNVPEVEKYFGIQINKPVEEEKDDVLGEVADDKNLVEYIADEEHYTRVFEMMRKVKQSLKIATGDLKNFNIIIENGKEKEMIKPCDFFLSLVERGIHVQVVSMKPYYFYNYTMENCPQLLDNPLFELRCNEHNHMKVFVFDDKCVYVGSANLTSAAIGKRARKTRNHEAGVLLWGSSLVEAPLQHFERVWNHPDILKSTWKRFIANAKEVE